MKESIKILLLKNKNLFKEDMELFDTMVSLVDDLDPIDHRVVKLIEAFISKYQDQYGKINSLLLSDLLVDDEEASIFMQLDRECSRANRYQQNLTTCMVHINYDQAKEASMNSMMNVFETSLRDSLRKTDCVGLYRVDKLLILLPNTLKDDAMSVIKKLEEQIHNIGKVHNIELGEVFSVTEFIRWESYELLLKRLEYGILRGIQNSKKITTM
jgi:GGDEF domain-containing protein